MSAVERWKEIVETHHAQSVGVQDQSARSEDFWRTFAAAFRDDPFRTDDTALNRLLREIGPDQTVLDVGGGAGRLALPLALHGRQVSVVDPSESMLEQLAVGATEAGIVNITVVKSEWEEAQVGPADAVLCSHVLYGVADVVPFIKKLESHATERVLVLMYADSPQSHLAPFWKPVHGHERVNLPAMRELLDVLWELNTFPDLEMLQGSTPHVFESGDKAVEQLRQRLYVAPDTEQDRRLKGALADLLIESPDGLVVRGAAPRRLALISWRPH